MCGIHGFMWQNHEAADRMVAAARHRGPDGAAVWSNEHATLGHNLLAISATPEVSTQPWKHGPFVLVFNGEIYNYRDLRGSLSHVCRTDTDTEVLAAGLAEQGHAFLSRLDGMFALAFYDTRSRELILARDSNGAKPLYYGYLNDRIAFSSEIRSLLTLGFDRRVSREGFKHYLHAGLVAGPLTMFDGISKLVPGEIVHVNARGFERHFNLNDGSMKPYEDDPSQLPSLISQKLQQATRLTLTGRREIGLFLSGGMDSASILHELRQVHSGPINTFTTRFVLPHFKCRHNEDADIARALSKHYGTNHQEVLIGERRWLSHFESAVAALEEPRQGKSHPAYYTCNQVIDACGVVVTLSGDGGDELLMGYKHQLMPPFSNRFAALRAGRRSLRSPELRLTPEEQDSYLASWLPKGGLTGDAGNDFMYTESLHTLAEDFLIRNDKLGMAFGIEARFPMMCKVFRDFVRSVPSVHKVGTGLWSVENKKLLRVAYSGKLPDSVVSKTKSGWRAPTDDWIIGTIGDPARDDGLIRSRFRELLSDPVTQDLFEYTVEDIDARFLNNRDHLGPPKPSGKPSVGIGLMCQKELFTIAAFSTWLKAFDMRMW